MPLVVNATLPYEGPFFPGDILTCLITIENQPKNKIKTQSNDDSKIDKKGGAKSGLWNWLFPGNEAPPNSRTPAADVTATGSMLSVSERSVQNSQADLGQKSSLAELDTVSEFILWGTAQFVGYYSVDPTFVDTSNLETLKSKINYQVVGFDSLWNTNGDGKDHIASGGGLSVNTSVPLLYPQTSSSTVKAGSSSLEGGDFSTASPNIVSPNPGSKMAMPSSDSSIFDTSADSLHRRGSFAPVVIPNTAAKSVYPIITMHASVLFTNLSLKGKESRSFSYQLELPSQLPGSYPGRCISVAYTLCLGFQLNSVDEPTLVVNVPVRIYPRVAKVSTGFASQLLNLDRPFIYSESPAHVAELPALGQSHFMEMELAKAAVIRPLRAFKASSLVGTLWNHKRLQLLLYGKNDSNSLSASSRKGSAVATSPPNSGIVSPSPSVGIAPRSASSVSAHRLQYDIAKNEDFIGRVTLLRNAYRLGETIQGVIDFTDAAIVCYKVSVALESYETVAPELSKQPKHVIAKKSRRVWGSFTANTTNTQRLPFQISIPTSKWGEGVTTSSFRAAHTQRTFKSAANNRITTEIIDPAVASAVLYAPYGFSPEFLTNVVSLNFALRITFSTSSAALHIAEPSDSGLHMSSPSLVASLAAKVGLYSTIPSPPPVSVKYILPPVAANFKGNTSTKHTWAAVAQFPETGELDQAFLQSMPNSPVAPVSAGATASKRPLAGVEEFIVADSVDVDCFDCTVPVRIFGWVDEIEGLLDAVQDPNFLQNDLERSLTLGLSSESQQGGSLSPIGGKRRASVIVNRKSVSVEGGGMSESFYMGPTDSSVLAEEGDSAGIEMHISQNILHHNAEQEFEEAFKNKDKEALLGASNIFGDICQDEVSFWALYVNQLEYVSLGGQQFQYST